MRLHALMCLLSAAVARVGLAAPLDNRSAAAASSVEPRPSGETGVTDDQPATWRGQDPSILKPNGIFGNSCPEGKVRIDRECVTTEARLTPGLAAAPLPPPSNGDDDYRSLSYEDFFRSLDVDQEFLDSLDNDSDAATAAPGATPPVSPVAPTPSTRPNSPTSSVRDLVNSLNDTEFLTELLRGVDTKGSASPTSTPTLTPTSTACAHGVVLVTVGSVLLLAVLVVAVWIGLRWRAQRAAVSV